MEIVLAAVVTGAFGLWAEHVRRQVTEIGRKIQTNNGKEPYEYLEMIAEVKSGQDRMVDLLADHTVQDALNFAIIDRRLDRIEQAASK